jgi:chitinase
MASQTWTVVNDPYYKAPYAYRERDWIGYDDPASIKAKAEYARDMGLGGGMVWSLETDDFNGKCHGEGFPLIRTIYRTLIGEYSQSPKPTEPPRAWSSFVCPKPTWWSPPSQTEGTATERPTYSPPQPTAEPEEPNETESPSPSKPEPPASDICKTSGPNKDPEGDCSKFYNCVQEGNGWRVYPQNCAPGTAFDPESKTCTYPSAVPGCSGKVKAAHHYKTFSL